ncbi:nickel ABC transporter permease [Virgibacillus halophilus]|uniref:Nickel import system permease protein NikB n=1 Tax=Tigheibacillus halophilus TaxID=361280 RepID=A0ABU5C2Q1_9BACI|nr:ABC transporter permease [Virgibacillus halophilus]
MISLIIRRFFQLFLLLFGISFIVFISMFIAPGDPAAIVAGPTASASDLEAVRASMGLDKPVLVQYFDYLAGVFHGDFGYSYQTGQSVSDAIISRFPNTFKLGIASMIVAIVIGVITGILSAIKHNSWIDLSSTTVALLGVSIPNFWLGAMLILVFGVNLQLLPVGGLSYSVFSAEGIKELILPAITLGTASAALIARMSRSSMLEVIKSDYIRTARAKGVKRRSVVWVHALRNAMIPVITIIGIDFGALLGGTVITEQVFAINGIGRLMIDAIAARDFPIIQGTVLLVAAIFVVVNLVVDIIYALIDPRISYE